ncbi:MAG: glutamate synthase-related protein, partial [Candidatus Fimenecus sp.]
MMNYIVPEFEIERNINRCISCGACVRQCSYEVHYFDDDGKTVLADESKCVACHRCAAICPTRAIKIKKYDMAYKEHSNWTPVIQKEINLQAATGGVLLSGMSNNKPYPIYWDKILLNASQVTNPSIDPLREPMEIRTFLGRKPEKLEFNENGELKTKLPPQIQLETPIMFSAMSFGSISFNAQKSLAMAAKELGTLFNTGEGGLHPKLEEFKDYAVVQVASGRFGVHKGYLESGRFIEIKIGQGAKPGIGGHLPGEKVTVEVSNARMIPVGSDAISPAPHHDIYSIEDLRQLIWSLKEATQYKKPVAV